MFGLTSRLFGPDPRLEFRKPGVGVSLLAGPILSPDDPYWAQYWLLFDSPADVITLLDSHTLSLALTHNPANLITLIKVLCTHIFTLLALPSFPGTPARGGFPFIQVVGNGSSTNDEDLAKEALTCVRVLSRVIPFVISSQVGGGDGLEDSIFWSKERVKVEKAPAGDEGDGQFVIDDEDEGEGGTEETDEWEDVPPLAESLLSALVGLAFVAGFTVSEECRPDEGAIAYVIWEPGIASAPTTPMPPTAPHLLSARLEILRLLNILLALPSLLTPPHSFPLVPNRWRDALVGGATLDRKVVLCLLCSILNTALASGAPPLLPTGGLSSLAGGFGLGGALDVATGAAEKLGGVVLRREDVKGLLKSTCLQLLSILLVEHGQTLEQPSSADPTPSPNAFTYYLSKLHRASDFDFIRIGIFTIFNNAFNQPLLPVGVLGGGTGAGRTGNATEALVVLWRTMEYNPKFLSHMLETECGGELLVHLLTFCLEFKDDETQLGLVRLAAFMLQSLTAERKLASRLNGPVDLKPSLRGKYSVPGTLGDFLIVSIHTLVFTTKARLASLYPAFVLAIANTSVYLKRLSVVSATRLLQLFLAFSAPSFLLMEEGNPRLVFYLLETFNNLVHFQLSDNPNLIYAIIRSHARFEELSTFTLAGGIAEVRRVRTERRSQAVTTPVHSTPASPVALTTPLPMSTVKESGEFEKEDQPTEEQESPAVEGTDPLPADLSEKARGKLRERTSSMGSVVVGVAELSLGEHDGETFVGKNGFVPTEGWVGSWREGLPLDSIHIMLSELRPTVLDLAMHSTNNDSAITYLQTASLLGLLPPAPPIRPRRFIFTPQSLTWLASLVYGSVYLSNLELLRNVQVQLFAVAQARRASSAVEIFGGAAREILNKARSASGPVA